ncbi:helicase MOV-10 [Coprinopsis cinerea okayama7|uniref:Helicase MOV-10 n=1 Tax=Coprinopsis cinerea (strain Okayama-7 / 130 / ATCC MYA-4618 / FGSC 9003) TaxID=240176 RepID=A8NJE6_COPC7|nr:helicase MOV-10 [Coprinopsis cinerea okayama7\|eukprot:XP_001834208.2 helicase MOV-10 [Coprinopsis cinerea okayama7\
MGTHYGHGQQPQYANYGHGHHHPHTQHHHPHHHQNQQPLHHGHPNYHLAHHQQPQQTNPWPTLGQQQQSTNGAAANSNAQATTEIHDFWKSRLAPLPGFVSRPELAPARGTGIVHPAPPANAAKKNPNAVVIKRPDGSVVGSGPNKDGGKVKNSKDKENANPNGATKTGLKDKKLSLVPPPSFAGAMSVVNGASPSRPEGEQASPSVSPSPSSRGGGEEGIPALSPIDEREEDELEAEIEKLLLEKDGDDGGEKDMELEAEDELISPTQLHDETVLDIYADPFIPQWLKDVQSQHHTLAPVPPIPIFPSVSYLQNYLPQRMVEEVMKKNMSLALISMPPPPPPKRHVWTPPDQHSPTARTVSNLNNALPPLAIQTYYQHFVHLLRWELDALARLKENVVLWKIGVQVLNWREDTFVIYVPNVRGDMDFGGKIGVGDLVHLREVVELKGPLAVGAKGNKGPRGGMSQEDVDVVSGTGTGRAFEARVTVVRRREGLVHITSPTLKQHIQTYTPPTPTTQFEGGWPVFGPNDQLPYLFNVTFMLNSRPFCVMEHALAAIYRLLDPAGDLAGGGTGGPSYAQMLLKNVQAGPPGVPPKPSPVSPAGIPVANGNGSVTPEPVGVNLIQHWLFPEEEQLRTCPPFQIGDGMIKPGEWKDHGLNAEQKSAVTSIAMFQSPVPHLISGPPGTGKTRTVVETVLQILRVQPQACILLCAPSNPATDTLVQRLKAHLLPRDMLRLNDQNRTFAEVPDEIRQYCYVENDKFALPHWKTLLKYRVVVTSCLDASILAAAQLTNLNLMHMEDELVSSIHPRRNQFSKTVIEPHWTHLLIDEAAQGSEPELLIPISVVVPHAQYVGKKAFVPQLVLCGDPNQLGPIVTSEEARAGELDVSLLERLFERPLYAQAKNYRSHPVILMPPSAIFYNDTLEPCAKNGTVTWRRLPVPHLPLKFIGHEHPEATNDERATWYNKGEIRKVVDTIKSMLADNLLCTPPLRPADIGVMAPWREQVWKLREELRKEKLHAVDVGTVEDFQGRESRVVIISCVRSNPRFLEEDAKRGLGIFCERKRMNVAITRAKELLVVVGNGALLSRDPYWKSFLQFALRNKLYEGPELSLESDGNYISRLESQLLYGGDEELDPEEQGILMAGGVAREVLREDM